MKAVVSGEVSVVLVELRLSLSTVPTVTDAAFVTEHGLPEQVWAEARWFRPSKAAPARTRASGLSVMMPYSYELLSRTRDARCTRSTPQRGKGCAYLLNCLAPSNFSTPPLRTAPENSVGG